MNIVKHPILFVESMLHVYLKQTQYLMRERVSVLQDIFNDQVELVEPLDDLLDNVRNRKGFPLFCCHGNSLVHFN